MTTVQALVRVYEEGGRPEDRPAAPALAGLRRPDAPLTWIHAGTHEAVLQSLNAFGLSDVAVDSLREGPERPRVEEYADHVYVSFFAVDRPGTQCGEVVDAAWEVAGGATPLQEGPAAPPPGCAAASSILDGLPVLEDIRAFLGPRWLITVGDILERDYLAIQERIQRQVFSRGRGASFMLFFAMEWAVETLYPVMDQLDDRVEALEDMVVVADRRVGMQGLFSLKRDLVELRRRVAPLRDALQKVDALQLSLVDREAEVYFRDLHDDVLRLIELLDTYRDVLSSAMELYLTSVSNRLGEIMKRLTVVATVFMPLTFLTGFFGMNFAALPFHSPVLLAVVIVVMLAVPVAMLAYFHRKDWW